MTSITKLELDQKEKAIQDLKQKDPKAADPLQKASEPLQQQISQMSKSLREKDQVIEQLELLLRRKEREETEAQQKLVEKRFALENEKSGDAQQINFNARKK